MSSLKEYITNIADAIRYLTETSNEVCARDFAELIANYCEIDRAGLPISVSSMLWTWSGWTTSADETKLLAPGLSGTALKPQSSSCSCTFNEVAELGFRIFGFGTNYTHQITHTTPSTCIVTEINLENRIKEIHCVPKSNTTHSITFTYRDASLLGGGGTYAVQICSVNNIKLDPGVVTTTQFNACVNGLFIENNFYNVLRDYLHDLANVLRAAKHHTKPIHVAEIPEIIRSLKKEG